MQNKIETLKAAIEIVAESRDNMPNRTESDDRWFNEVIERLNGVLEGLE